MSTSVLRFIDFIYVPEEQKNNPEYFIKYYNNSEITFTLSNGIYLTTRQSENNCTQYCNSTNFTDRLNYEVVRYSNGSVFEDWKIIGSSDLDYTHSNLANASEKKLRSLVSSDSSIQITTSGDNLNLTSSYEPPTGDYIEINDLSNLNNTTTKKIKNLTVSGDLTLTNNTDEIIINSSNCLLTNESNLIIPETKTLNSLRVTAVTKTSSDGKIQLTQEEGNLTINIGNCLSRHQQDGNLSNIQSNGYCRSIGFDDSVFTINTSNASWLRLQNNKLLTYNPASVSGIVSNLICTNSSNVVQKELKNIVAGDNITLTSSNETLTISASTMSTSDLNKFKWTTITKNATPGEQNLEGFYEFDIGNNQYIYLVNTINLATFEIKTDSQDYINGIPTKTCIIDMTQSSKSCYVYWNGKFYAKFLRVGCVYHFIYTPSTEFTKFTMISDNDDKHTQYIDTLTSPYITIKELHNRDTYIFNCAAGKTNTLLLYVYDEFLSLGNSIDIFGQNMNTSNTILNVVLCNSNGTPYTQTDAKKINNKFTSTPHESRNVGLNKNWSTDHEVSFWLESSGSEYMNVLHLDVSSGNYIVWY